MKDSHKQKFFLTLVASTALILAIGVWNNYRPTVVLAGCSDIALKSSNIYTRTSLPGDYDNSYDQLLNDCMNEAGY